jgi:hypothetical protein
MNNLITGSVSADPDDMPHVLRVQRHERGNNECKPTFVNGSGYLWQYARPSSFV